MGPGPADPDADRGRRARLPALQPGALQRQFRLPRDLRGHLSILGALTLALFSFSYWLANFNLLYSTRGYVFGAGRTDLVAQRPANYILLVLSALAALLLAWNAFARRLRPLVLTLGVWGRRPC